jgi:glyoxylase-like metal-dependent hydrolase (beta-lactamase superfamily II)
MRHWTAYHEDWKQEVGSVAFDSPDGLLFFDPIEPPDDLGEPTHTFITVFFHARDAGGRVWAPNALVKRLANRGVEVTDPFEPGDELPGGVECYPTARNGEVVYWVPSERTLVVGDVLLRDPDLRLCPNNWLRPKTQDDLRESLRPLLELPIERIAVAHGEPVLEGGHAALAGLLQ